MIENLFETISPTRWQPCFVMKRTPFFKFTFHYSILPRKQQCTLPAWFWLEWKRTKLLTPEAWLCMSILPFFLRHCASNRCSTQQVLKSDVQLCGVKYLHTWKICRGVENCVWWRNFVIFVVADSCLVPDLTDSASVREFCKKSFFLCWC